MKYELNVTEWVKRQQKAIIDYYVRKRQAENESCKCYECKHFDEEKGCCKKEVKGK